VFIQEGALDRLLHEMRERSDVAVLGMKAYYDDRPQRILVGAVVIITLEGAVEGLDKARKTTVSMTESRKSTSIRPA